MRALFSGAEPAETQAASPAVGGWEGLPGWAKLGASTLLVGGVVAAIVLPGIGGGSPPKLQNQEPRPPSRITDYQPPPPPSGIQNAAMNMGTEGHHQGTQVRRLVPTPTPMALYAASETFHATGQAAAADPSPQSQAAGVPGVGAPGAATGNNPLTESVSNITMLPTSRATLIRNRSFLIQAGSGIPCNAVEAKDSTRPGFVTCRLTEWYRSDDMRRGLLPPGTKIFGQIREGLTSDWQPRLGVVYTQIQTPWFKMNFAAPGADAMGRAGEDVEVKSFFWDRAGSVALYGLMDATIGIAQGAGSAALSRAMAGSNGTSVSFGNFGGQAQGLASQEMQHQLNRPPVGTRDPALPLTVTVGQDLDFTDACRMAMQVFPMACPLL